MEKNYLMKNSTSVSKIINIIIGIVLLILFWIILSYTNDNFVFPKIKTILSAFIDIITNQTIIINSLFSLLRVILVILISLIISLIISFIYMIKKDSIYLFKPLIIILKSSPLAIISVYLWISLGANKAPYIITLLMILPVIIEGFISSLNNIDIMYINQLKTEDVSYVKKFFKIYIPLIMPYIFMTVLQSFGLGIKVMLMSEYICQSNSSLGEIIYNYKQNLDFPHLLALLLLIVIIVSLIELMINLISKKLIKNHTF